DGLPIGMTAYEPPDLKGFGQMIGFNCAACHVGLLSYKDRPPVPIPGAPNIFDLNSFIQELFACTEDTFRDPKKFTEFRNLLPQQDKQVLHHAVLAFVTIRKLPGGGGAENDNLIALGKKLRDVENNVFKGTQSGDWTLV